MGRLLLGGVGLAVPAHACKNISVQTIKFCDLREQILLLRKKEQNQRVS
jgi:hypothetical protein